MSLYTAERSCIVVQMADFGLSRVLESDATHVSTFTYGGHFVRALHRPPNQRCI